MNWNPNLRIQIPRGVRQNAYQILVASSEKLLAEGKADLWDSGKVESDRSIHIEYGGKPLKSRTDCHWKVRVWTVSSLTKEPRTPNVSPWSQPARWTMGLLEPESWQAKWIGLDRTELFIDPFPKPAEWIWFPEANPAASASIGKRYFRRSFNIPPDRKIEATELRMTADNSFVARLYQQQAGAGTDTKTPATMDVTRLIKPGANVLTVTAENIGPGANPAGLIAALKVMFSDGEPLLIHSDAQWKSSQEAPGDWESADFKDESWAAAKALGALGVGPWGSLQPHSDARPLSARYLRREFDVTQKITNNPHFPALQSVPMALSGASRRKQSPSK